MKTTLKTSVVGSYPQTIDTTQIMNTYFSSQETSWEPIITQTVQEMLSAGIDYVSDGQTRDPIVQLMTRQLSGCRIRARPEIIGPIEYSKGITVDDQQFVRSLLLKNKGLVGIITGPFTLTKSCVDLYYHDEKETCFAFAEALHQEAERLQKYVDLISIDEPCFSQEMPDYAAEVIKKITRGIRCPTRLHVCGDVSRIIPQLLELPVTILSHEFKASPHLLSAFKKYSCSKQICLGSVRSDDPRVEPVEEIVAHIKNAVEVFNGHLVQIAPDCGQRYLPKQVAYQKLKNLALAGAIING